MMKSVSIKAFFNEGDKAFLEKQKKSSDVFKPVTMTDLGDQFQDTWVELQNVS